MATDSGRMYWANTGASYTTPLMRLQSGSKCAIGADPSTVETVDGDIEVPGLIQPKAVVKLIPVDANCLLDLVLRETSADDPPPVPMQLGNSQISWLQALWQIGSCEGSCEAGGVLELTYEFWAPGALTPGAGAAAPAIGKTPFVWYTGGAQLDSADKRIRKVSFKVDNAPSSIADLNPLDTPARHVTGVSFGAQKVTGSVEFLEPHGVDLEAATPAQLAISLVLLNTATEPVTITVALANLQAGLSEVEFPGHKDVGKYVLPFKGDAGDMEAAVLTVDAGET